MTRPIFRYEDWRDGGKESERGLKWGEFESRREREEDDIYKKIKQAAPYDWRIPPSKLEQRDAYFTRLRDSIKTSHRVNGQKVVLLGHSMGCRVIQYFLIWCDKKYPGTRSPSTHSTSQRYSPPLFTQITFSNFMCELKTPLIHPSPSTS